MQNHCNGSLPGLISGVMLNCFQANGSAKAQLSGQRPDHVEKFAFLDRFGKEPVTSGI
jgi:hypothetical protein